MPAGITFADLKGNHPSKPRNWIIADVCFKGGYIDAWGLDRRGFSREIFLALMSNSLLMNLSK